MISALTAVPRTPRVSNRAMPQRFGMTQPSPPEILPRNTVDRFMACPIPTDVKTTLPTTSPVLQVRGTRVAEDSVPTFHVLVRQLQGTRNKVLGSFHLTRDGMVRSEFHTPDLKLQRLMTPAKPLFDSLLSVLPKN